MKQVRKVKKLGPQSVFEYSFIAFSWSVVFKWQYLGVELLHYKQVREHGNLR